MVYKLAAAVEKELDGVNPNIQRGVKRLPTEQNIIDVLEDCWRYLGGVLQCQLTTESCQASFPHRGRT